LPITPWKLSKRKDRVVKVVRFAHHSKQLKPLNLNQHFSFTNRVVNGIIYVILKDALNSEYGNRLAHDQLKRPRTDFGAAGKLIEQEAEAIQSQANASS